jgi:hypothetical protein
MAIPTTVVPPQMAKIHGIETMVAAATAVFLIAGGFVAVDWHSGAAADWAREQGPAEFRKSHAGARHHSALKQEHSLRLDN